MELRAGAVTRRARRLLDQLARAHAASARVVTPTAGVFDDAGLVLQALRVAGREVRQASLLGDVLIALTARQIGATVYTANAVDFEAIRRVREFRLEIVSAE
jgi:predicted nucleic acid-binding protein